MNAESNRNAVRRIYEECLNQGRFEALEQIVSPEYAGARGEKGPKAMEFVLAGLRASFPDIRYELDELFADGDRVAVRWTWKGTHSGQYVAFAPTQKVITNTGMAIYELRDGKIVGSKMETDRLGFLVQIGGIPPELVPVGGPGTKR